MENLKPRTQQVNQNAYGRSATGAGNSVATDRTFSPAPARAVSAGNSFAKAREAWRAALIGTDLDLQDKVIAARLRALAATSVKWQAAMDSQDSSSDLWADLPLGAKPGNLASTARRLRDMAIGWAARGSETHHDAGLEKAIIDGLGWFTTNAYTPTTTMYGNWYEWKVSTPQALNDVLVLLYDRLDPQQIGRVVAAQAKQVPQLPTTGTEAAAANLALIVDGYSGRGVLAGDMDTVDAARAAIASLLSYAKPFGGPAGLLNAGNVGAINGGEAEAAFFSNDGFHPDGSFIQHGQFPYAGGYGANLLSSIVASIVRTAPLGTPLDVAMAYGWIHDSFEPFLWQGRIMDTVCSRNVAFEPGDDRRGGHGILGACLPLLSIAGGETRQKLGAMLKQELQSDTIDDPMADYSLAELSDARSLLADSSVTARGPLIKTHTFGAMDRFLHRKSTFAVALAMNSWRTSNYETGDNENVAAWYTSDGALYLYTHDLAQFDFDYWFTVDPYRIPGTTVDCVERAHASIPWRAEYHNPDYWAGGVDAGMWGAAALRLKAQEPSSLKCRKSWFFFGDEILCLGEGITAAPGRTTETIVENRRATPAASAMVTVDGRTAGVEGAAAEHFTAVGWAHLDGVGGYVFPDTAALNVQRQSRSGRLSDISPRRTSEKRTNTFSTLWLDHTTSATNKYGYIMLPNASAAATEAFAANPGIRTVAQSATAHAGRHEPAGRFAAIFFASGTVSFISAEQPCAVAVEENDTDMILHLSDPTQMAKSMIVDLDIESSHVIAADRGITVGRVEGRTRISADVSGAVGASRMIRLRYSLTLENVSGRIKMMYQSGHLANKPYKVLEDCLKSVQQSTSVGSAAEAELSILQGALARCAGEVDPPVYDKIEDLVSRLVARIGRPQMAKPEAAEVG